jgi:Protein of unknown function (DUF3987)
VAEIAPAHGYHQGAVSEGKQSEPRKASGIIDSQAQIREATKLAMGAPPAVEDAGSDDQTYRLCVAMLDLVSPEKAGELLRAHWLDRCEFTGDDGRTPEEWLQVKLKSAADHRQNDIGCDTASALPSPNILATIEARRVSELPEPYDLLDNLTETPTLTHDMLPPVIADYAWDAAERMGVNPAMIALPMLSACAAAISDKIKVQPRVRDTGWLESARINFLINAPVGSNKTASLSEATGPLEAIDQRWQIEDAKAIGQWERNDKAFQASVKSAMSSVPKTNAGLVPDDAPHGDRPKKRRLVISDTTTEGTAKILRDNPRGLLLKVDEAAGWIAGFDAYRAGGGQGKDRAFWLQADNGGPYAKDRVDEKSSFLVPNLSVSITGGIQPDRLLGIAGGLTDDGLIQRTFVVSVDEESDDGKDRLPDEAASRAYTRLVERLVMLEEGWTPITLSPEAQTVRADIEKLAKAFRRSPASSTAFKGHLGKWGGRIARLMLLIHLIENGEPDGVISGETAERVRKLMVEFLLPHQIKFYADYFRDANSGDKTALWVAGYILAHRRDKVSQREILKNFDTNPRTLAAAMERLNEANWITGVDVNVAKRSTTWTVSPLVHERFAEQAERERQRRARVREQIQEAAEIRRQAGFKA